MLRKRTRNKRLLALILAGVVATTTCQDFGFVVNAEGIFDADRYFSEICAYRDYNTEYWKNLKSYNDSTRLLSPTEVVSYSENEKTIIPVILPLMGEISNSLFIFNIDAEKLYAAVAEGAAAGMENANVRIYWNDREAGRIMRDMGVQFA